MAVFRPVRTRCRSGFCSAQRDTENADGTIATLSISLPVTGDGGYLAVRQKGRRRTADMCVEEPSELAFGALYTDYTYEVSSVVEGYRLSLVLNLYLYPGR